MMMMDMKMIMSTIPWINYSKMHKNERVFDVTVIAITVPMIVATTVPAVVIYGAQIVAANEWAYSKNGAKINSLSFKNPEK